jgi:phospholipase/lecithinase/hemolysin
MKARSLLGLAALAIAAACGGGGSDESFESLVSFGDSLSDVGSYRTPGIAALGGGQYTVNGAPLGDKPAINWTELMAMVMDLPAPCAARTGLESSGPLAGLAAPVTDHASCTDYAQGGARVTHPVGPWNKALLDFGNPSGLLGQLTEPVSSQVAHHLQRSGGRFDAREFVTVWAGANDLFMQLFQLQAAIAGGADPAQASQAAVQAMAGAGAELAELIKSQIVGKGARRALVLTVPDAGLTPFAAALGPTTSALMTSMAAAFNASLASGLAGNPKVLLVDTFAAVQAQHAQPGEWGLENTTTPACDMAKTPIPTSLVCSSPATVVAGDISFYLYADDVHPTPYGHLLIAATAYSTMVEAHWAEPPR